MPSCIILLNALAVWQRKFGKFSHLTEREKKIFRLSANCRRDGGGDDEGLQHMSVSGANANIIFGGDHNGNNYLSSTPAAAAAASARGMLGEGEDDLGEYRSPIDTTTQL